MSGHLPADAWCKRWTAPIVLMVVLSVVFAVVACGGDTPAEAEARKIRRSTSFWVTVAAYSDVGPGTYVTREPVALPDGSKVVCVATFDHLWCRDAK